MNAIHFTGDAFARWEMLDFQIRFTTAEGAGIGMPYVSHDIGSFQGGELPSDLYVRWVQFGAFQPILRLHSDHGERLPWDHVNVKKGRAYLEKEQERSVIQLKVMADAVGGPGCGG